MAIKRVLITGSNSYVGTNVEKWLMNEPDKFYVETISVRGDAWKSFDFSKFDVVFHVAGIAHVSPKKSLKDLYYLVNRDLAIYVAKKARDSGVKQFIFTSSMIIYSSKETLITKDTIPNPDNFYGKSKLEAEIGLTELASKSFIVNIQRLPMIYGPNTKGNFRKLLLLAKKTIVFPNIHNKRSMITIHNFCNVIKNHILLQKGGTFYPQNSEYSDTVEIVKMVNKLHSRKIFYFGLVNPFIYLLTKVNNTFNKLFSDFYYEKELSINTDIYNLVSLSKSIENLSKYE